MGGRGRTLPVFFALVTAVTSQGLLWFPINFIYPVKVSVYLEALCPDSKHFVVHQLAPTWNSLRDILDVDITAYGFATDQPSGYGYSFNCQHGPDECHGNMVIMCAKKYLCPQEIFVDFTICLMSGANPPTEGKKCAKKLGVDWSTIEQCAKTPEGEHLLHEAGLDQYALKPVPNWVPWIILNDVYSEKNQEAAESNLTKLICKTYQGEPPAACRK